MNKEKYTYTMLFLTENEIEKQPKKKKKTPINFKSARLKTATQKFR